MIRRIVDFAVALVLVLWAFIGWSLWTEYSVARSVARAQSMNLTIAISEELERGLDTADLAFRQLGAALAGSGPGATLDAAAEAIQRAVPAVKHLVIVGADGRAIYPEGGESGNENLAATAHFAAHRDDPGAGMLVDPPGGAPGISVSERLATDDGHFAGEAIMQLDVPQILSLARRMDIGPNGTITIAGLDRIVRASFDRAHSDGAFGIGINLGAAPFPSHLAPGETGTYSRIGLMVPALRQITIRRLAKYPFYVTVALDQDEVLGPTRARAWLIGSAGVVVTVLIGVLTWLLAREVWRRISREIELAHDRDRLRAAQAQIETDRAQMEKTRRELTVSKEQADAANRARTQFLAHMSHELRTPLHSIIGFSELIRDQAPTNPKAPPIATYADDILSAGRHLLELINTVLDISKIESGTATLVETVFVVNELMRNASVVVSGPAETRGIYLDVHLLPHVVRLHADRTRLLQVLINLLSNAVKFTPLHGTVVFEAGDTEDGGFEFVISDKGIGMTEGELRVALEPFGQVDNSLSRSVEGTGLGLPLAVKMTELHGGRLDLTSAKGQGTTARVILPASRVAQRGSAGH